MVESIITKDACIYCNGQGLIYTETSAYIEVNMLWVECAHCNGTGYEEDTNEETT